jgi:hypothetical protein
MLLGKSLLPDEVAACGGGVLRSCEALPADAKAGVRGLEGEAGGAGEEGGGVVFRLRARAIVDEGAPELDDVAVLLGVGEIVDDVEVGEARCEGGDGLLDDSIEASLEESDGLEPVESAVGVVGRARDVRRREGHVACG